MSNEDKRNRELFERLKSFSDNEERYISEIINNAIFNIINRRNEKTDELNKEKIKALSNHMKWILKELYEDYIKRSGSNKNITEDIEYVGSGFTCITFRVGDNIIKLGKNNCKNSTKQLDSKYQVPTYVRGSYEIGNKAYIRVEIAPYVDTKNITYEDAYKAYRNIRKLGYIWNDPKEENIGRIINVSGCKIGDKKYVPKQQYKKGDLVVIDLDDIAYVGEETSDIILDEIATASYNKNVYIFETRYIEEKKRKTGDSIKSISDSGDDQER